MYPCLMFVIRSLISFKESTTHHDVAREPPITETKLDFELALTAKSKCTISHYLNKAATKTAPRLPSSAKGF
jgi:hypothetical protein